MIWLALFALVAVFIVGFRVLTSDNRYANKALSTRLNLKPDVVESMANDMGREYEQHFTNYLSGGSAVHLENAAYLLFIYQVFIVNPSEENLIRWRGILTRARLSPYLSDNHVRLALFYFTDMEIEASELYQFKQSYNIRYNAELLDGNVIQIDNWQKKE